MKKYIFPVIAVICFKIQIINAQSDIPFKFCNLEFKEFIELVKTHNLEYAAEKLNINISEAAIEVAKIFKDPYVSVSLIENSENRSVTDYGFSSEIGKTIELGGKRKARIDLTRSENELTKALVADYFRNLQAEATLAYLEGMKQKQLFKVKYDSYQTMKKLHEADSIRFKLGSNMEIDVIQSKLEAGSLLNESIHAMAEWKNSLTKISLMAGISKHDTLFMPSSHLHDAFREFSLDNLITEAVNNRADLLAALLNREVSQKNLILARKERKTDLDLKLGVSNSWFIGVTSPASRGITGGIAVPLKFSNLYRGELQIAQIRVQQSEALFCHAELQVKNEIMQAWELYQDYCKQVDNFEKGLLKNAENVRKGKIYSYQRGETSLLEVLNAQRTYNDIQTTYFEVLFNRAAALVELEKAAGIWDINF